MDFKDLYMIFVKGSHTHTLKGLQAGPSTIISYHRMEKLLKKWNFNIIVQLHDIQAFKISPTKISLDLQQVLVNHR